MLDFVNRVTGGLFGNTSEQDAVIDLAKQNQKLYGNIKLPELSWKDYIPELYQAESANHELVNEDPTVRSNQLSALENLKALSTEGLNDADKASFFKAEQMGHNLAKQNRQAAMEDAQRRGVSGSGLEFAMREMGNQGAAQQAQSAGLEQAAQAARQRALYAQAYGQGLNQMRSQDQNVNSQNADIINRFNQLNTANRNQVNQANVDQRNQAGVMNQNQRNAIAQNNFNNQITKAGGQAGANQGVANTYAATDAAKQAGINTLIGAGTMIATGGAKKQGA